MTGAVRASWRYAWSRAFLAGLVGASRRAAAASLTPAWGRRSLRARAAASWGGSSLRLWAASTMTGFDCFCLAGTLFLTDRVPEFLWIGDAAVNQADSIVEHGARLGQNLGGLSRSLGL